MQQRERHVVPQPPMSWLSGTTNLSCYSHRLMGYRTQNIDRLAREGMMFTDAYGEQSCTAGRSALLRLQLDPFRSNSGGFALFLLALILV